MEENICTTCRSNVMAKGNFVKFDCPDCGKGKVVRCKTCKDLSNRYKCVECEFEGP